MTAVSRGYLVRADDAVVAQGRAVALAVAGGYRVLSVLSVRLRRPGEHVVRLAVEPREDRP